MRLVIKIYEDFVVSKSKKRYNKTRSAAFAASISERK